MNLTGQRFGRLIVTEKTTEKYRTEYIYRCQCDCGKEKLTTSSMLKRGVVQSCGCLRHEFKRRDVTGKRFGRLVAISPTDRTERNTVVWKWQCDCGNIIEASMHYVTNGSRRSCGCLARDTKKVQAVSMQEKCGRMEGTSLSQIKSKKTAVNNTSGRRGVTWNKTHKRWSARIQFKGKSIWLGWHDRIEDAIKARKKAEIKYFKKFVDSHEGK